MKTKFDSIVKVKKQEVDRIERDIRKIDSAISEIEKRKNMLEEEIKKFKIPKDGSFFLLNQIKTQQSLLRSEIQELTSQIAMLNSRKRDLLEALKEANIEYEKMKYLKAKEIEKKLREERIKDAQLMDEIALMIRNYHE